MCGSYKCMDSIFFWNRTGHYEYWELCYSIFQKIREQFGFSLYDPFELVLTLGSMTQVSVCFNIKILLSALLDPSCVCLCYVWASFLFGVCNGDCVSRSVSF